MTKFNEDLFYVIILNCDITNPMHWEYVAKKNTMSEIDKVNQYSVDQKESISKTRYDGTFEKNIPDLICTETGNKTKAMIYKLTKKKGQQ
jgi:hypothetical protein